MTPPEPTGPQTKRVLAVLRQGGWRCLRDFGDDAYVARNRLGELRRDGWRIESKRCDRHSHEGSVSAYRLLEPPQRVAEGISPIPEAPLGLFPVVGGRGHWN